MTELLDQLSLLPFDPEPVEKTQVEETANYSENGVIFANLIDSLESVRESRENFSKFLYEAISHKIWLGFVNPINGRLCSFIHKSDEGEIDHSVSFKLWVSSGTKKGGLGFTSLDDLEVLLKHDRKALELALPYMVDFCSIRRANELREANGESPLMKLEYKKQYYLSQLLKAPPEFATLHYDHKMPFSLSSRCASTYLKMGADEQPQFLSEVNRLRQSVSDKNELQDKLSELFEIPNLKIIHVDISDSYKTAKALVGVLNKDKDKVSDLIEQLKVLIK